MELRSLNIRKIENRTVDFIISDGSIDAHGTILSPGGWDLKRFEKNGLFSYQHNIYFDVNPDFILGPASAFLQNEKLIGRATFETEDINPLAEKIFRKVTNGTLKAVSVGFIPKRSHMEKDITVYDEMELLEFSIVNIPSNPNAVKRSFKKGIHKKHNILNYL
jgi:hypothetical protein